MCLAVPARVVESCGEEATVDLQGNRLKVCALLTPEAVEGDWVLVHAGFAITTIDQDAALQTWDYLRQVGGTSEAIADSGVDPIATRDRS